MRCLLPLVGLVLGCHKAPPIPEPLSDQLDVVVRVDDDGEESSSVGDAIVGPARWRGGGVALDIPAGWRARAGVGDVVVRVTHVSGVQVRVRRPDPPPALSDACAWTFDDVVGRHRDVPVLYPASTATCLPRDPVAPVVQAWWGGLYGKIVQVELHLPPGTLVAGRDRAVEVLGSLGVE